MAAIISLYSISCASTPEKSCGYIRNVFNQQVRWRKAKQIIIIIPTKYAIPARAAAKTWNDAIGREVLVLKEGILKNPSIDRVNGLYFDMSLNGTEQGRTSTYWIGDSIYETDIRISKDYKYYWGMPHYKAPGDAYLNLEALILHEFGHVLGLGHYENSVMNPYLSFFEDRISLTKQDISNIVCGYGNNSSN